MKSFFITGVDTDIGKTFVSLGLALIESEKGKKTGYYKPLQSGAYEKNGLLIAPDPCEIKKYVDIETKYSYLLKGEVSPYLASKQNNVKIDIEKIKKDFSDFSKNKDTVIIEGAGGVFCPIKKNYLFSNLIKEFNQEVIIVTTPDLGRINHSLLTIEAIKNLKVQIKGIIVNKMPKNPNSAQKNFVLELKSCTDIKILGIIDEIEKINKKNFLSTFSKLDI